MGCGDAPEAVSARLSTNIIVELVVMPGVRQYCSAHIHAAAYPAGLTLLQPAAPAASLPTFAAALFSTPKALTTGSGIRSRAPPILKFWIDRCVCAPQYLRSTHTPSGTAGDLAPCVRLYFGESCAAVWAGLSAALRQLALQSGVCCG
jgi:hypothetical protein